MLNMRFFYTANRARGNSTSKSLVRALVICCNAPVQQKADLAKRQPNVKNKTESARKRLNATSVAQFAAVSFVNSVFRFVCAVIIEGFLSAYSASVSLYYISFCGLQLIVKPSLGWSGPRAFIRRRLDLRIVYRTRLHSECF